MRFHKKKAVRPYVDKRVKSRTETRDGIIWDVDSDNKIAWVKIQGSDSLINAHFPQNLKDIPQWARRGNAVSLRHREGVRGYLEVAGEGRAIPTPALGVVHPEPVSLIDAIIEGLEILPTTPPSLGVYVTSGAFRISGRVYYYSAATLDFIIMDNPAPMTMGPTNPYVMGVGNYTVAIAPGCPESGEWRYDLLQIGTDLVVDYITGECSTDPAFPEVSDEHLQIGEYIFVSWATSVIEAWNIGYEMTIQIPTWIDVDFTAISPAEFDSDLGIFEWCDPVLCGDYPNPEIYVNVYVRDQLGLECYPGAGGFDITLELTGTGQVWSADDGYSSTSVTQNINVPNYSFKYKRIEDSTEYSPKFVINLESGTSLSREKYIYLMGSGDITVPREY